MRNPLVLPKITKLAGDRAWITNQSSEGSEMSVKLSKGHHKTLVISARSWFYFLHNIGLNPDVFFVVNRCSDSVAFGNEIMPVITFLNITDHQCHWLVSWDIWIWAPFPPALMLTAEVTLKMSVLI